MNLLKIKPSVLLKWDYKLKESNLPSYQQKDWNQTLLTMLNQASAMIGKKSLRGGANTVSVNLKLYPIIETLEFFNPERMLIAGRYNVVIDNALPEDKIFVSLQNYPLEPLIIDGINTKAAVIYSESPMLQQYMYTYGTNLTIISPSDLLGEILILNYE